jgi:hypothetical protein
MMEAPEREGVSESPLITDDLDSPYAKDPGETAP